MVEYAPAVGTKMRSAGVSVLAVEARAAFVQDDARLRRAVESLVSCIRSVLGRGTPNTDYRSHNRKTDHS